MVDEVRQDPEVRAGTDGPDWIAMRDRFGARLGEDGRGGSSPGSGLAECGTLMAECRFDATESAQNLVRAAGRETGMPGFVLRADPRGGVRVVIRQGARSQEIRLETQAIPGEQLRIVWRWDAAAGPGALAVHALDRDVFWAMTADRPLPLPVRDLHRLITDAATRIDPSVDAVAVAEGLLPLGPLPTLSPDLPVESPSGAAPVGALRRGDTVLTADGGTARVLRTVRQPLPALGGFAPVLMRAPYNGLREDIVVAAEQRVRIAGSEVEYLFAEPEATAAASDLVDGRAVQRLDGPGVRDWAQVVLDRPAALLSAGLALEPMTPDALLCRPGALPHSLLAELDVDTLRAARTRPPRLRSYETQSWRQARAA
ncbi:Hint domain-containing protein [Wenxinia marina]|uniref:Hint domain protein n=1 Tax=Wenxinia marina DSM 24838 TaxID=1123501 RepID=A0A0D0NSV3_9RHOB|nr:Hint domain-containing protein [Wenxinia marina]KIQ71260.1 Hint domain protein [Wenxinia marina DSM 24838]GGL73258.1 hypothetical protein GCM10011392_29840 [Wenxinia marina]